MKTAEVIELLVEVCKERMEDLYGIKEETDNAYGYGEKEVYGWVLKVWKLRKEAQEKELEYLEESGAEENEIGEEMKKYRKEEVLKNIARKTQKELRERRGRAGKYEYGRKTANVEILEIIQNWDDAEEIGLDYEIEKVYKL